MTTAARVSAQGKINLGLRVLAREAGGYHQIETVFARLALADVVEVRITDGVRKLDVRGGDTGPLGKNLALRAALAFISATGWPPGFSISLQKHIPVGAGLGGGSADAGAVLRALNALAPHPVEEGELLRIAAPLGADVPFLTSSAALALAWGRGERLLRLPPLPGRSVALVQPGFTVNTADAYAWLDASREATPIEPRLTGAEALASWESIARFTENDFEPIIAHRHAGLVGVVSSLRAAGASIARMTGTGSTVYGIYAMPPDVKALSQHVPGSVIVTSTAQQVEPVERIRA
jgi:4-diphosphocytidyl-2-C-methyl-D-erythritol kinase